MLNLDVIEKYRKENNFANIYGFILYTSKHSNIAKVLNDNFYWQGFDELSKKWIIFAVKPEVGHYDLPSLPEGFLGMMVPIWKEPVKNLEMLKMFDIESTSDLPLFVAFIIKNKSEVDRVVYKLKDDSVDNARNSIKGIIADISETVDFILPEYYNSENVFRNVRQSVESKITIEKVKNVVPILKWFAELFVK